MEIAPVIALAMGAAWASGINLYAAVFMLGVMGSTGHLDLPSELMVLTDPLVIIAAGFMYCVEFFADKIPGVDTGWDTIHTFIRIPAGAALAAGAFGEVGLAAQIAAGLVGGTVAAGAHATKAGTRVLINTSPEPVTNWTASVAEDVAVFGGLWAALNYPIAFLVALAVMVLIMVWAIPKLWRGIRTVFGALFRFLGWADPIVPESPSATPPAAPPSNR